MRSPTLSRWHWLVALIIVANVPLVPAQSLLFQQFFPGWDGLIRSALNGTCSGQMKNYTNDPNGQPKWDVIECLFDDGPFTETRKAEAAAAALTLGLAPTVLQNIGPSTSETSLLFTRRPLLALLLAISSPWPRNPDDKIFTTAADPPIPVEIFTESLSRSEPIVLLVEYALALGAAANVALLAYQLGHWGFFMSANNVNDPVWWTYCLLIIHLIGILGIYLRFKVHESKGSRGSGRNWFRRWCYHEWHPEAYKNESKKSDADNNSKAGLQLQERKERFCILLSVLATWALSIAPTMQVLMGTIMLSGSLLTNQADARNCLFRYVCSAIVARALLTFELAYLNRNVEPRDPKESWGIDAQHGPAGSVELRDHRKTETGLSDYTLFRRSS
ncbi:hypothetical protein CcaCcLH18_03553 [Colletotrichum camelliae]|nr:hypothetical protein CcaCcLH18_03553 [Colletotrichum camelliae]